MGGTNQARLQQYRLQRLRQCGGNNKPNIQNVKCEGGCITTVRRKVGSRVVTVREVVRGVEDEYGWLHTNKGNACGEIITFQNHHERE
jgi:hypothetical protein